MQNMNLDFKFKIKNKDKIMPVTLFPLQIVREFFNDRSVLLDIVT